MNEFDILDAIGGVDDLLIEKVGKAREKKRARLPLRAVGGTLAACAVLVLIVNIPNFIGYRKSESADKAESVIVFDNVALNYVEGNDIKMKIETLPLTEADVFNAWRELNGIGDEVIFMGSEIKNISVTTEAIVNGRPTEDHILGDTYVYTLTVSANLADYYDTHDEELLLRSLEATMTGYTGQKYSDFNIVLK